MEHIKGKGKDRVQTDRISKSRRAALTFPVARLRRTLREGKYAKHIQVGAAVYIAAAIEYLTAEIMELSGTAARDNRRKRITPRHMMMAIKTDSELDALVGKVIIPQAGVLPFIHTVLLPENSKKNMKKGENQTTNRDKS